MLDGHFYGPLENIFCLQLYYGLGIHISTISFTKFEFREVEVEGKIGVVCELSAWVLWDTYCGLV